MYMLLISVAILSASECSSYSVSPRNRTRCLAGPLTLMNVLVRGATDMVREVQVPACVSLAVRVRRVRLPVQVLMIGSRSSWGMAVNGTR